MIRERLVKIIICSTLFSLATNCSSAIASKLSQHSDRELATELPQSDRLTEASNNDEFNRRIGEAAFSERAELQSSQNISEREPQPSVTQNALSVDESPQIDRRLSAIAMAVTMAISLVLLWSLFRKRPQERASEELSTIEGQELQELAEDRVESETIIASPSHSVVNLKETNEINSLRDSQEMPTFDLAKLANHQDIILANNQFESSTVASFTTTSKNIDLLSQINDRSTNIDLFKPLGKFQQGDRALRQKTIWQLAIAGDTRSIEPLIELMLRVDYLDRDLISKAIAQILHRSFKPVNDDLFEALQDKNSEIRKSAIDDLTVLYGFVSPMTRHLVQMQQDPDPEVSQAAIQALQQLNLSSRSQPSNHHSGDRLNFSVSQKENTA
jgi:hypothetical protein